MVAILAGSADLSKYGKELQLPDGYAPQIGVTLGYAVTKDVPVPERRKDSVSYIG
jgi:hypothetical protein